MFLPAFAPPILLCTSYLRVWEKKNETQIKNKSKRKRGCARVGEKKIERKYNRKRKIVTEL